MTDSNSPDASAATPTGADLCAVTFPAAHGFGRGYDAREVDAFVARTAAAVDTLHAELSALRRRAAELQDRVDRDSRSAEVAQAVSILTTAQKTADKAVADADAYSAKVMSEARDLYEDTRRNAATLEQETEEKAKHVYDEALARAAALERETEQKLSDLTMSAVTAQKDLDQQTAYLRTLRDATRTQMEVFLEGMLDRVAEEYGRAHPLAVEAANQNGSRRPRRPARTNGRSGAQSGRGSASSIRVAGLAGDRRRGPAARDFGAAGYPPQEPDDRINGAAVEFDARSPDGR